MMPALQKLWVFILLFHATTAARADDARDWLDRMHAALENLNYTGTFVHSHQGRSETLEIVHRHLDGVASERVLSRDGIGREIVRRDGQVRSVLPDRQVVINSERPQLNPLIAALPNYSQQLEANYKFKAYSTDRVANRLTQVVGIAPRDEYRYGYVLWLDWETAMPLKSRLWSDTRELVEEILFTDISFPESIEDSALEPTIPTDGFTVLEGRRGPPGISESMPWRVAQLPSGFELIASRRKHIPGSEYPVEHMVFSDGLATVSVFIEDPKTDADVAEGFSALGSTNAYSLTMAGRKVTAVGEVPRETVEAIANSVETE